jgi:hypothetical protein
MTLGSKADIQNPSLADIMLEIVTSSRNSSVGS